MRADTARRAEKTRNMPASQTRLPAPNNHLRPRVNECVVCPYFNCFQKKLNPLEEEMASFFLIHFNIFCPHSTQLLCMLKNKIK